MDEPTHRRSRAGKVVGSVVIAGAFGFFFLVFWFARFLFKDSDAGRFGHGKTLDDLVWSHLGSSMLFVAFGALTIWLLWTKPDRRLRVALIGSIAGILTVIVFRLVIGQFSPDQGVGSIFFYLAVVALMVIAALATVLLLLVTVSLVFSRRRSR
ncbi:MAG: hypothetical protein JW722_07830 [Demequinaceae bacterium]|nr:hypothetical protein [Demequinaceae bacterium]